MTDNVDKALPNVSLVLGGKERSLRLSLRSVAQLRRLNGYNLLVSSDRQEKTFDLLDPVTLIQVLWALLITNDPSLDGEIVEGKPTNSAQKALDDLEREVDIANIGAVYDAVRLALNRGSSPKSEEGQDEKKDQTTEA